MNAVWALAGIPSPSRGVWHLGPLPIRAYGILIVTGMVVAVWWSARRYARRGGDGDLLYEMALWAIPFGIVGARLYSVVTTPDPYFGPDGNPALIPQVWTGGLGIWGAVAVGALGAWIAVRRAGVRMGPLVDSIAPALLVAQAIGRWGNYFNQELFGAPTTLPWGLRIDAAHLPAGYAPGTLFHPTFLYECLWDLAMAGLLVWIDRRHRLRSGQLFAVYLMAYTAGRSWIEMLRIDDAQHFFGVRLNVFTSGVVLLLGVAVFVVAGRIGAPTTLTPPERAAVAARRSGEEAGGERAVADTGGSPRAHGPLTPGSGAQRGEGESHDKRADGPPDADPGPSDGGRPTVE